MALIVYGVFSCYSSLFLCFITMEQNNNTSRPYSSTLSTFLDHVKQYLATIPPVTRFALYTPIVVCIFDRIVFPLLSLQVNISSFISLNAVSFQGKSILFSHQGDTCLIIVCASVQAGIVSICNK